MLVTGAPDRCNIIGVHRVIGVNIYIMGLCPCSLIAMQVLQWLPYELLELEMRRCPSQYKCFYKTRIITLILIRYPNLGPIT